MYPKHQDSCIFMKYTGISFGQASEEYRIRPSRVRRCHYFQNCPYGSKIHEVYGSIDY